MATKPENNQTPEEQLLRLIEDQRPAGAGAVSASTADDITLPEIKPSGGGFKSVSRRIAVALGRSAGGNIIKAVNKLLVVVMVLLAAYIVWGVANASGVMPDKGPGDDRGITPTAWASADVSEYLSVINQRDIFNPLKVVTPPRAGTSDRAAATETPPVAPVPPARTALDEARKHLKLIGIIWEPAPALVTIDEVFAPDTPITRLLKEGEILEARAQLGEKVETIKLTIKQITREKVILQYEQEEAELVMKGGY